MINLVIYFLNMKESWKQLLHRGLKGPEKTAHHAQFTKEEKT